MPKVSEDHRVERRRQIIDAAMRCFTVKGFEGTSMADIITESDLSAGAIYSYFKSKQDLIVHVTRDVLKSRADDLDGLEKQHPLPTPQAVVRLFIDGMTRDIGNPSILVQIWAAAAVDSKSVEDLPRIIEQLTALYARYLRVWFVRNGMDEESAASRSRDLAPVVVGICQGYILQSALVPDFDADRYLGALDLLRM